MSKATICLQDCINNDQKFHISIFEDVILIYEFIDTKELNNFNYSHETINYYRKIAEEILKK